MLFGGWLLVEGGRSFWGSPVNDNECEPLFSLDAS